MSDIKIHPNVKNQKDNVLYNLVNSFKATREVKLIEDIHSHYKDGFVYEDLTEEDKKIVDEEMAAGEQMTFHGIKWFEWLGIASVPKNPYAGLRYSVALLKHMHEFKFQDKIVSILTKAYKPGAADTNRSYTAPLTMKDLAEWVRWYSTGLEDSGISGNSSLVRDLLTGVRDTPMNDIKEYVEEWNMAYEESDYIITTFTHLLTYLRHLEPGQLDELEDILTK